MNIFMNIAASRRRLATHNRRTQSKMPSSKRKAVAPPKGPTAKQQQLEQLPLLKKPLEVVGEKVNFPGSFWEGRMTAEEKDTQYVCIVREFSALHTFGDGSKAAKGQAFQLQEMGPAGTGSLEHGDSSGDIFWCKYPFPFLTFFYDTYPEKKPQAVDLTKSPAHSVKSITPIELDGDGGRAIATPDVHPDFPHLRLSKAPVMEFYTVTSDMLQEAGPKSGQFAAKFECIIVEADGRQCCKERTIYHRRMRACSTTNLILHIRERAAVCPIHKAALAKIEAGSTNFIELDGETVAVYNFNQAFKCVNLRQQLERLPCCLYVSAATVSVHHITLCEISSCPPMPLCLYALDNVSTLCLRLDQGPFPRAHRGDARLHLPLCICALMAPLMIVNLTTHSCFK